MAGNRVREDLANMQMIDLSLSSQLHLFMLVFHHTLKYANRRTIRFPLTLFNTPTQYMTPYAVDIFFPPFTYSIPPLKWQSLFISHS